MIENCGYCNSKLIKNLFHKNEIFCNVSLETCPFIYNGESRILYKIHVLKNRQKDEIILSNCSLEEAHDKLNKLKAFT